MEKAKALVWSFAAKQDLFEIYDYYSQFSIIAADNIIDTIIDTIIQDVAILKQFGFENTGQVDEYNPNYRRLISGNYKIFYKVFEPEIVVIRIFNCSQNPEITTKF